MPTLVNDDVSCCWLDERLYFLDIARDRYFQLEPRLEAAFLQYLQDPWHPAIDHAALGRHRLLRGARPVACTDTAPDLPAVLKSVLEMRPSRPRHAPGSILDVLISVVATHHRLKTRPLKSVLQSAARYRHARHIPGRPDLATDEAVLQAATAFLRVRPYVPVRTCCLIDSLAMIDYLARRRMYARLVMGVACDPFSAHAWVQSGTWVLNDTVGNARTYEPIRII